MACFGADGQPSSCTSHLYEDNAAITSSTPGVELFSNETDRETRWPSSTGTRLQWTDTYCQSTYSRGCTGIVGILNPDSEAASTPPNIFEVSHSIFSSSPPICGTTLSRISKLATPGYPTVTSHPAVGSTSSRDCLHSHSTDFRKPTKFIL